MTELPVRDLAAGVPASVHAGAARSGAPRQLLDAAVARVIATLAHDLRNALGVISMQVEAIAVRAVAPVADLGKIQGHANVAADHIERLAEMTNALIAFARGRTSSDLAVIVGEAAALVPLRAVTVSTPSVAAVGLDPLLVRAVALEVLVLALGSDVVPSFSVGASATGATLLVQTGFPLLADASVEWVVQFQQAGGRIDFAEDGLRLQFPPIA